MKSLPKELIEAYAGTDVSREYVWFMVYCGETEDNRIYYLLGCCDDIEKPDSEHLQKMADNISESKQIKKENICLEQVRVVNCPYAQIEDFSDGTEYSCQRCSECIFII